MAREIAVVMGNGTSMVFTDELAGDELAAEVTSRLPARLMQVARKAASDRGASSPRTNFEDLLGPLDRMAAALGPLRRLAADLDVQTGRQVKATERLVRGLYGKGVGAALAVVAERSVALHGAALDRYGLFPRWVLRRPRRNEPATVRIFNLNYDSLLDSRLLEYTQAYGFELADQADGRMTKRRRLYPLAGSRRTVVGLPLREEEYLPGERHVIAYHLHGSLAWLRDPGNGQVWKAESLERLRDGLMFFNKVADGSAACEPVVVLTDRKQAAIGREPFASAYRMLRASVATADTVIVAGYGFGDVPLNAALADALGSRRALPRIAVFGHGRGLAVRTRAARAMAGGDADLRRELVDQLRVCGHGLPNGLDCLGRWGRSRS